MGKIKSSIKNFGGDVSRVERGVMARQTLSCSTRNSARKIVKPPESPSLRRIKYESKIRKSVEENGKALTRNLGLQLGEITPIKYQGRLLACQVAGYGSLAARAEKKDQLQHDHIPSIAAIKKSLEMKLNRRLGVLEKKLIYGRATTVELPDAVHRLSRTFKARNTQKQITEDAKDLYVAACKDIKVLKRNLAQFGVGKEKIAVCVQLIHLRNVELGLYTLPNAGFSKNKVPMKVNKEPVAVEALLTPLKRIEQEDKVILGSIVYTSPKRSMFKREDILPLPFPSLDDELAPRGSLA